MAMVFPLNPSEGFPISPTLRENAQSRPLNSPDASRDAERGFSIRGVPGVRPARDRFGRIVLRLGGVVREPLGVVWEALTSQRKRFG